MAHPLCFSKSPITGSFSSSFIPPSPSPRLSNPTLTFKIKPKLFSLGLSNPTTLMSTSPKQCRPRATPQNSESGERAPESEAQPEPTKSDSEVSRLASRVVEKDPNSLSGVMEEIREIDWPGFNKVLGTTGVVLGVIAGSSVILLTVNAVLAELSDRVFAGKGVQDFFS